MTEEAPPVPGHHDIPEDVRPHLPEWFNEAQHRWSCGGIQELATGLMLDGLGLPLSGHSRARRLAETGAATDPAGIVPDSLIATHTDVMKREAQTKAAEDAEAKRAERERKAKDKADAAKTETPNA